MIDSNTYFKNLIVAEANAYHNSLIGNNVLFEGMKHALHNFERTGLPDLKNESWKYTPIAKLMIPYNIKNAPKSAVTSEQIEKYALPIENRIVFVNGHIDISHSVLPKNVKLTHISTNHYDGVRKDVMQEVVRTDPNDPFENLNITGMHEAYAIEIGENAFVETPLSIIHLIDAHAEDYGINTRLVVRAKKYARATIMESYGTVGAKEYVINAYTDFILEEGAYIEHIKNQDDSDLAIHIGKVKAQVEKQAYFNSFTFTTGAKVARNTIEVNLNNLEASTSVNGLYSLKENQHCDNTTMIHHNAPETNSEQLFKGVASSNGHGVFTGNVTIHRHAQKSNSSQVSSSMLLGKESRIDARPQLEIYADDVKATHGATVGKLDREQTFYLESRGMPRSKAEQLLCRAFARDALQKIKSNIVKNKLEEALEDRLNFCLSCEKRSCDE